MRQHHRSPALATSSTQRAFTLIELMIVVAIVGVLAALAIYGVRKYLLNAKTAEARNAIGQIAKDAKTAFERESLAAAVLPAGGVSQVVNNLCITSPTMPKVPATTAAVAGKKYQSAPTDWISDASSLGVGWSCLKFTMSDPQYYSYGYAGTSGASGTFAVTAEGDLDGNSVTSAFTITGAVVGGIVVVAPNFSEVSPEE